MGFRINTNIAAMNSHASSSANNRSINNSLEKLSSGLRINKAADDASGLAIADSLRSQASGLGQAIKNANDGINIIQIADKAMDEQTKILDTIKTKAIQSAEDGQTSKSRRALQADITRLMEELDNIAGTTSFNGQQLLSGQYTNKEFQVGAYSNQKVQTSIGATSSDKIGSTRFETGKMITAAGISTMKFSATDGTKDIILESVTISTGAGTGIGVLAETINKNSDKTGVRASFDVHSTGTKSIAASTITGIAINGIDIGEVKVEDNDKTGALVDAINAVKDQTGIEASIDSRGRLNLVSNDGRGINAKGLSAAGLDAKGANNFGRLSLTKLDGRDIKVSASTGAGFSTTSDVAQATVNLRDTRGAIDANVASAMGFNSNSNVENIAKNKGAGVTTLKGAQAMISIAESAQKALDRIRSDLGSVQNQLTSTVDNISVTQVNVAAAESNIRDVDFAAESATFNKHNLLAQSGSYAMSQANSVQQNVMRLLQ